MIEPGTVVNEVSVHEDMLPTLLAAVGESDVKERLKTGGLEAIGRSYKVHLDGYNLLPYFKARPRSGCVRSSSIGPMSESSPPCVTIAGS